MTTPKPNTDEQLFKAKIVHLIINSQTEKALEQLSQHYHITIPKLKIGMPKRNTNPKACYSAKDKTIYLANSESLNNPYVILHEFYHHLRTTGVTHIHRGTEKNADKFAKDYIETYYTHFGTSPEHPF